MVFLAALDAVGYYTLLPVAATVVVLAGYLIWIARILGHVANRLVTVLGAIRGISEKSEPIGALIEGVNAELEAGRSSFERSAAGLEAAPARSAAELDAAEGERVA